MDKSVCSTTNIVFVIISIALVVFTYKGIITGDQFMKMVEIVFIFFFVKKGYDTNTTNQQK
jgi:hypothetical protein